MSQRRINGAPYVETNNRSPEEWSVDNVESKKCRQDDLKRKRNRDKERKGKKIREKERKKNLMISSWVRKLRNINGSCE